MRIRTITGLALASAAAATGVALGGVAWAGSNDPQDTTLHIVTTEDPAVTQPVTAYDCPEKDGEADGAAL